MVTKLTKSAKRQKNEELFLPIFPEKNLDTLIYRKPACTALPPFHTANCPPLCDRPATPTRLSSAVHCRPETIAHRPRKPPVISRALHSFSPSRPMTSRFRSRPRKIPRKPPDTRHFPNFCSSFHRSDTPLPNRPSDPHLRPPQKRTPPRTVIYDGSRRCFNRQGF